MTDKEQWPEGATHKIGNIFTKWVDDTEYSFYLGEWIESPPSWSLNEYLRLGRKIIERPEEPAQYVPEVGEWHRLNNSVFDVFYVGIDSDGWHILEFKSGKIERYENPDLRPIKSERDVFIEKGRELSIAALSFEGVLGALYDNGARFGDE